MLHNPAVLADADGLPKHHIFRPLAFSLRLSQHPTLLLPHLVKTAHRTTLHPLHLRLLHRRHLRQHLPTNNLHSLLTQALQRRRPVGSGKLDGEDWMQVVHCITDLSAKADEPRVLLGLVVEGGSLEEGGLAGMRRLLLDFAQLLLLPTESEVLLEGDAAYVNPALLACSPCAAPLSRCQQ